MQLDNLVLSAIPEARLQAMEKALQRIEDQLTQKHDEEIQNQWIESKQVPKILRISTKTWQSYRDKGVIPFSQFGSKIYVRRGDIESFLQEHYINKSKRR
jgi:hypothetical protein